MPISKLRLARKQRGISTKDAAKAIGIHPSYLSGVENFRQCPTIDIYVKLGKLYNMNPNDLVESF